MSSKGSGTQGFRYYMSILSGLCRGPLNEMIEIKVGDKGAWSGHACSSEPQPIEAGNLFGGDDKEGGIEGSFAAFMGGPEQVLPGVQQVGRYTLPDVKASLGGYVSQMRGVACIWFDGMVSAMNPYLKTWAFRVRRTTAGWYNDDVWYPAKATIFLGGKSIFVTTNRANDLPVSQDPDTGAVTITFTRNGQEGDKITLNGFEVNFVADQKDSLLSDGEFDPDRNTARTVRKFANFVNARSTMFKLIATYDNKSVTFTADKALQDIYAMNAAHIIFQCFTDPLWGRGLPWSELDEASFMRSANTLCAEGFGVSLIWYRKEDIDEFIRKVVDLVGGVTYTNRETGKIAFDLIRNDYDPATVPLYTPSTGLLDITDDDAATADNSYNEVIGTSLDPVTNLEFQVRAQNLAAYQSQGAAASMDQDYKGIPTKSLLQRVVLRDLRAMASGLKRYTLTLDRRAWRIKPGSVIRISHPGREISNLILRVGDIDDGNMLNGQIIVKAAVDVFGLPATSYQGELDNGWIAPSKVATPALDERLIEASYRDFYRANGNAEAEAVDPNNAYVGQLAVAPNATSLEYDLLTRPAGAEFNPHGRGIFTGNARLNDAITPLQTEFVINSISMLDTDNVGQALLIDDELVRLDGINGTTLIVTRGVGDTVPAPHDEATIVWTVDDDLTPDGVEYAQGETVYSKVLTRTSSDVLDADLADEMSVTLVGRVGRPYPPANVTVDGQSIYTQTGEHPTPVLAWASRNRITQGDVLTGYLEGSIFAEPGTTYTVRVYGPDDALLRTVEGLTETTWTYTPEMLLADGSPNRTRFEIESVRDGFVSWQNNSFAVAIKSGWGYGWGSNWGAPA